jgi:hypothetical protein
MAMAMAKVTAISLGHTNGLGKLSQLLSRPTLGLGPGQAG